MRYESRSSSDARRQPAGGAARGVFWGALASAALIVGLSGPASAHENDCGTPVRGCAVASGCHGPSGYTTPSSCGCTETAWDRYARRRGFRGASGSGWGVLRTHLTGKQRVRRAYLRGYFLRRYPLIISANPYYGRTAGTLVDDLDLANGGGIVLADPVRGEDAPQTLDPIERLNRGMARLRFARYAEARSDFDAALRGRTDLHAARFGRLLCAVVAGRLEAATADLDRLADAGELRTDDRLVLEEIFGRQEAFPS